MSKYIALAQRCRLLTLISLLVLLVVIAIDTVIIPNQGRAPNVVVWIFLSLPLAIFLPGMRAAKISSFAWVGYVSLLYFALSVTALFSPARRWVDVIYLLASIALFIGAMFSVRFSARAQRSENLETQ